MSVLLAVCLIISSDFEHFRTELCKLAVESATAVHLKKVYK